MVQIETLHVWSMPRRRRCLRVLVMRHLSLAFMLFLTSVLIAQLSHFSAGLSCVWLCNGVNISFVLCTNPRHRNELLLTSLFANLAADLVVGNSFQASVGLVSANLLEVLLATWAFRRLPVNRINLTEVRTLLRVGLYATLFACGAATAVATAWLAIVQKTTPTLNFISAWYCADALGTAIIIPLYWSYRRKPRVERTPIIRHDSLLAFTLFLVVVFALFWQTRFPLLFLLFPVLLPVIYTSAFVGAARAMLGTSVIAVFTTAYGHGPLMLIHTTQPGRVLILQFYLAVVLFTAFPFAVLLMERERLVRTLQKSETRYRELARLDGLTQLPNRREFDSFLEISRQRSVRQDTPLSLLLIDIDHFKKLNDQHGHTVGDEYLRKMAAAIASAVPRKTDLVARYGGEEFAVVLDSCDDPGAMMVAVRIKEAAAALSRNLVALHRPAVTISIGVATTLPQLRTPAKVMIDAADQGLYAAKRNGRDRIERGTNLIAAAESII